MFPFRFWLLFAIPFCIIISEGLFFLINLNKNPIYKYGLLIVLIVGIIFTSLVQKYSVNTAMWGPGGSWASQDEIVGYLQLLNLPKNSKVFSPSDDGKYFVIDGEKRAIAMNEL